MTKDKIVIFKNQPRNSPVIKPKTKEKTNITAKFFPVRYKLCENHLRIINFWITVISLKRHLAI